MYNICRFSFTSSHYIFLPSCDNFFHMGEELKEWAHMWGAKVILILIFLLENCNFL